MHQPCHEACHCGRQAHYDGLLDRVIGQIGHHRSWREQGQAAGEERGRVHQHHCEDLQGGDGIHHYDGEFHLHCQQRHTNQKDQLKKLN